MILGLGLIRLALALTVVITHTHSIWGFTLGNSVIAVRTFFVISGFYMTLVLTEKYTAKRSFWINRFLKIYPIYWTVIGLTILSCIGAYLLRGNWGEMLYLVTGMGNISWLKKAIIILSQVTIFGRSLVMFNNFDQLPGAFFLLVPQAWTLVLELWFYLMAPWVLTKKWPTILLVGICSLFIKNWLSRHGYVGDIWTYRFFPSELIYFLMGWGSYKIFKLISNFKSLTSGGKGALYVALAIVALSTFNFWTIPTLTKEWYFYFMMMVLIPIIFDYSKKSKNDRLVGDLSYPVYVVHILANNVINPLLFVPYAIDRNWQAPTVMLISILIAISINVIIQKPIDKVRFETALK